MAVKGHCDAVASLNASVRQMRAVAGGSGLTVSIRLGGNADFRLKSYHRQHFQRFII